jgi:surfactin synthase thioesterase subunit
LFCFPHAGGNASAFRDWAEELAVSKIPVAYFPDLTTHSRALGKYPKTRLSEAEGREFVVSRGSLGLD